MPHVVTGGPVERHVERLRLRLRAALGDHDHLERCAEPQVQRCVDRGVVALFQDELDVEPVSRIVERLEVGDDPGDHLRLTERRYQNREARQRGIGHPGQFCIREGEALVVVTASGEVDAQHQHRRVQGDQQRHRHGAGHDRRNGERADHRHCCQAETDALRQRHPPTGRQAGELVGQRVDVEAGRQADRGRMMAWRPLRGGVDGGGPLTCTLMVAGNKERRLGRWVTSE